VSHRSDGRQPDELRPIEIELGFQDWADGSVLFSQGRTKVLVAASVIEEAPRWMRGTGRGWVTGEYAMLPRATLERTQREVTKGRPSGRTQEIQRLIGRSLRAVTDLRRLGERTIMVDCDVLMADAGTRCASITAGTVKPGVLVDSVAAVSVGVVAGEPVLDLSYEEDAGAEVDCNVVMTGAGALVEVQGTAEGEPFSRGDLNALLDLAESGIAHLTKVQRDVTF